MRRFHRAFLASLMLIVFTPWAVVLSLAIAVPLLVFMYQSSARAFEPAYARRQTMLALGLSLLMGLGLIVVPWLVDSDIAKALSRTTAA